MELDPHLGTGSWLLVRDNSDEPSAEVEHYLLGLGTVAAYSSKCPGEKEKNEDCGLVVSSERNQCVLAVSDGVGSSRAGDEASKITLEIIAKEVCHQLEDDERELRTRILKAIDKANAKVLDLGAGACCTLALVTINKDIARTYHVGDSSILIFGQKGKLKLQTISHSPIGYGVEAGMIDEKESMFHDERHLVSNVIGSKDMRVEMGPKQTLSDNDTLVIGSDGLFDNLHVEEIVEQMRKGPLEESLKELVNVSYGRMIEPTPEVPSKPDDLTVLAFRQG